MLDHISFHFIACDLSLTSHNTKDMREQIGSNLLQRCTILKAGQTIAIRST